MKYSIFILSMLLISLISLRAEKYFYDDYNLISISSNFNGSTFNDDAIIVYGDAGVILRSSDRGENWEQINLSDSLNILEIINIGSGFYGISNQKNMIWSNDDGKKWNLKDFGNTVKFYRLFNYNTQIIALLEKKIWILNQDLDQINEYSFTVDSAYYDGAIVGNKLVYSSGKGRLGYIELGNGQMGTINLASLGICSDCSVPTHLFSNNSNLIYFVLGKNLYQYNFSDNSAKFVFMPLKLTNAPFYALDEDVFQIYAVKFPINNLDTLYFGKADKINNLFFKIKEPGNDRYVVGMKFSAIKFISPDTIIAVGKGKLIYMSFDGGIHWELKSQLNEFSYIFLFDKLNARMIAPYARFISTTDGGATWLPQKNYNPVINLNSSFKNPINYPTIRYYLDKYKGLFFGESSAQTTDTNFIYTLDGGNLIKIKNINEIQHSNIETKPLITSCYDKSLIITQRKFGQFPHYLIFDRINNEFAIESHTYLTDTVFYCIFNFNDTLYAVGRDFDQSLPYKFNLYHSSDTALSWNEDLSFEIDSEVKFSLLFSASKIDKFIILDWNFVKFVDKDTLWYDKIYAIDIYEKKFFELLKTESACIKAFKTNDKYNFILYNYDNMNYEIIYTDNLNQSPILWEKYIFKRYTAPKLSLTEDNLLDINGFVGDSLFAFVAYDSLYNRDFLFYARAKNTVNIKEDMNVEVIPNLYFTAPKPIPAKEKIIMKIYWNQIYDINQADFHIYNLLGVSVLRKKTFSLYKINNYSGELTVNTSELSTGAYIIAITLGGNTRSAVFIIE